MENRVGQRVEKELNKVENSDKFGKAVFFGSNQEFRYSETEDQILAVNGRVLIENAVICWNYLYLTKFFSEIKDSSKKKDFIKIAKNSSIVT